MQTVEHSLWWRWLVGVLAGVMLFSLGFVFAPVPIHWFFNWMLFSGARTNASFSAEATQYITFVYGVLGAVMFGWMVSLLFLVLGPFRRGERAGWSALATSVTTWFVVDSVWSLASGFVENALFNVVFFVLFAVPLAASYRQFHPTASSQSAGVTRP